MRRTPLIGTAVFALAGVSACGSAPPPPSQLPSPAAAIARMRATFAACSGVQASAKIDHFGRGGRVRGDLLLIASRPARLRMDAVSPFGITLATLTTDGARFALADLRDKRFYVGPASACNIARLTQVPVPGDVMVDLLRGQGPVLKHADAAADIAWSGKGYYVVTLRGDRGAVEELHLAPRPDDLGKPWGAQRLRVLDVEVRQEGVTLYRAELDEHAPAPTAKARVDPDGIDPPIPPSGPTCDAELPRKIHVEVPSQGEDVQFKYGEVTWNPPLPEGVFVQRDAPPGLTVERVTCAD